MLSIKNVTKNLGSFTLKNISFELKEGYIMGLIGPNASGKTTLIKMILGLLYEDEGSIEVFNKKIYEDEIYIKNNIGFVYDELNFYSNLKVNDFKKINASAYSNYNSKKFDNYIERFEINKNAYIGNLSKGESMRLMLANALSHDAKLLILDEPTAGLDPIVRKEMLALLQQEIVDGDKSVLFSTHITSDLDGIADYITFINKGEFVFSSDMESIKEKYKIFKGTKEELDNSGIKFISKKKTTYYYEGLFIADGIINNENIDIPSLEDIMYHYVKGEK